MGGYIVTALVALALGYRLGKAIGYRAGFWAGFHDGAGKPIEIYESKNRKKAEKKGK